MRYQSDDAGLSSHCLRILLERLDFHFARPNNLYDTFQCDDDTSLDILAEYIICMLIDHFQGDFEIAEGQVDRGYPISDVAVEGLDLFTVVHYADADDNGGLDDLDDASCCSLLGKDTTALHTAIARKYYSYRFCHGLPLRNPLRRARM